MSTVTNKHCESEIYMKRSSIKFECKSNRIIPYRHFREFMNISYHKKLCSHFGLKRKDPIPTLVSPWFFILCHKLADAFGLEWNIPIITVWAALKLYPSIQGSNSMNCYILYDSLTFHAPAVKVYNIWNISKSTRLVNAVTVLLQKQTLCLLTMNYQT